MRRTLGLVVVGLTMVVAASAWLNAQTGASGLQGAWIVQSVSTPQPPANPLNKPMGMILFSGTHYAQVGTGNSARPDFPEGGAGKATADQLRATWGPVVADAGTFTVTGNTIKFTRMVAKAPAATAGGAFLEDSLTLMGDNLVLTQVRNQAGPVVNPTTVRFTRAR